MQRRVNLNEHCILTAYNLTARVDPAKVRHIAQAQCSRSG